MAIKYSVELVETKEQIENTILQLIIQKINQIISKIVPKIKVALVSNIRNAIKIQPEYLSLDNGQLAGDFGFRDGRARIDAIIEKWLDTIIVKGKKSKKTGKYVIAQIEIGSIPDAYEQILGMPEAISVTEKGQQLPWLQWLLFHGTEQIISGWKIRYGPIKGTASRSGRAIMIEQDSGSWGVPAKYSGTPIDNFLTRALKVSNPSLSDDIEKIIVKEFK